MSNVGEKEDKTQKRRSMKIRRAKQSESSDLSELTIASKSIWGYPAEYFEIWRNELTVTPEYMEMNEVLVLEHRKQLLGYYSLVVNPVDRWTGQTFLKKGLWLEHLFIRPGHIRKRFGSKLMLHALNHARYVEAKELFLFADPNSRGFYEKLGAEYIRECPSTIPGRTTPMFRFDLKRQASD